MVSISGTSWSASNTAAAGAWTCESISPGSSIRPPSSCTVVRPGAASARMLAVEPVATIRPPRMARASCTANPASTVSTFPPTKTASGGASAPVANRAGHNSRQRRARARAGEDIGIAG